MYRHMTNRQTDSTNIIDQQTITFIDDVTAMITCDIKTDIQKYLSDYYALVHELYRSNCLHINSDKTQLLLVARPKYKKMLKNILFLCRQ